MHTIVFIVIFCGVLGLLLYRGRSEGIGSVPDKAALSFLLLGGIVLLVSGGLVLGANILLPKALAGLINAPTYGLTGSLAGGAALFVFGLVCIAVKRLK